MLFTVVVRARSSEYTMRCSMSLAVRPVYCQITLTTGMLIAGKMSVGVCSKLNGVNNNSSRAATTKVYGRRSAKRTIHIDLSFQMGRTSRGSCRPTDSPDRIKINQQLQSYCTSNAKSPGRLSQVSQMAVPQGFMVRGWESAKSVRQSRTG